MAERQVTRYCRDCGYALGAMVQNACPECGRPFNPDDRHSYHGPEDVQKGAKLRRLLWC